MQIKNKIRKIPGLSGGDPNLLCGFGMIKQSSTQVFGACDDGKLSPKAQFQQRSYSKFSRILPYPGRCVLEIVVCMQDLDQIAVETGLDRYRRLRGGSCNLLWSFRIMKQTSPQVFGTYNNGKLSSPAQYTCTSTLSLTPNSA